MLDVNDLSIEFRTRSGTVRALKKVGFDVGRGETVALVGESGSGKPVTAYALLGLLDAAARITSGRIQFGGLDLLDAGERAREGLRGRELSLISARRAAGYPFELSGGMCQRVTIALALACERALLIADEPTTASMSRPRRWSWTCFAELASASRMTTILITHDLAQCKKGLEIMVNHGRDNKPGKERVDG